MDRFILNNNDILLSFNRLRMYSEIENFLGWDPYDGLNSKVFQALPFFKKSAFWRLVVIQGFKRCPINMRKAALVPKGHNPKGVGLFLTGYCNLYHAVENGVDVGVRKGECLEKIKYLADLLISLQSKGYSGACWGYNFDWQGRRVFFFPKYTPTVVATCFSACALMEAFEITKDHRYLDVALSSANFVTNDLHRTIVKDGFLFSYCPLSGNDSVINASLLGSKLLMKCYQYTGDGRLKELAFESIKACLAVQEQNGSWVYGLSQTQVWKDSFHTGYNLDALWTYICISGDSSIRENIERGFKYYLDNFFEEDGTPKYYNDRTYPIDIHCPAQFIITLCSLGKLEENSALALKVLDWTIKNMQDKNGYFYYQLKKGVSSKIPYMRWSNAFMFVAMANYLRYNKTYN